MLTSFPRIFVLLALMLFGVARAEEQTTSTMRIVVCAPSLAEYVYELGMFHHVVGVSRFTEYPPEAASLPAVTDFANPGLEAITALKPTVIIALQSNAAVVEHFTRQAGVQVVQIGPCETIEDAFAAMNMIASEILPDSGMHNEAGSAEDPNRALEGRDESIREVIRIRRHLAMQKAEYDALWAGRTNSEAVKVLMILGGDELRPGGVTAIGRRTHISQLLEIAGGENVIPESLGSYPMLNKEALLRYNPDLILFLAETPEDSTAAEKARASWSVLSTMRAVKRADGFRYLDDTRLMIPGPRALEALAEMRKALGTD